MSALILVAVFCLVPSAALSDLQPYSQDFEGLLETNLDQPEQTALANDGWLVFVNVFGPDWWYWYGYGAFPAPNGGFGGPAFSAVVVGEGSAEQGAQQLSVYSDYNNGNHNDGSNAIIESNVFQEQPITAADIGDTWTFKFDAKRGNIEGSSSAFAFFKTIGANFNYFPVDMTSIPDTWESYSVSITITPAMENHLLQFGFLNYASNAAGSGIFYDNISFSKPIPVGLDLKPGGCPNPLNGKSRGRFPAAVLGAADFDVTMIDPATLRLDGVAPLRTDFEDEASPFDGELCGCTDAEGDGFMDLTMKFDTQDLLDAMAAGEGGVRVMTLTGNLLDGTPIEGQDCVIMVGGGNNPALKSSSSGPIGGIGSLGSNLGTSSVQNPADASVERKREGLMRKPRATRDN